MARVDIEKLWPLVEEKYITARLHSTHDLLIWNYTPKTQFEHFWTEETMMCRGLITKSDGTIVAKPFKKFMNIEEHSETLPVEPFTVTEKMDGSLGILYFVDDTPYIATRGSFESDQAARANQILQKKYAKHGFNPEYTYLFEIVYPENRIVVNYGNQEDLILLAMIQTETGQEMDIQTPARHNLFPFPVVKQYDGIDDIPTLKRLERDNAEGFVIRFESGLRLKAKMAEYVRLHRILTQCTARTIWECMKGDMSIDDLLNRVPDEFYSWVQHTRDDLQGQYNAIEAQAKALYKEVRDLPTRRDQAMIVSKNLYRAIVFRMLDQKEYADTIWKMIKPAAERPFKEDIDA